MLRETLHMSVSPLVTVINWQLIPARVSAGTISTTNTPSDVFSVAVSTTSVVVVTAVLVMVNCACADPADICTFGNVQGETLHDANGIGVVVGVAEFANVAVTAMVSPPAGAGVEIVSVPTMLCPPATV